MVKKVYFSRAVISYAFMMINGRKLIRLYLNFNSTNVIVLELEKCGHSMSLVHIK